MKNLVNLQKLSLVGNPLRETNLVRIPMSSLEVLDLSQCNLRFISPFLVSMLDEKNNKAKLRVKATGNLNISVIDVRRELKAIKGKGSLIRS